MKKKIFSVMAVAAVATVVGYNVYTTQKSDLQMSDVMLANIEALADPEVGGNIIYCCGNAGECMKVFDSRGEISTVAGVKLSSPCP